ncbi:hypothetical protein M9H77_12534 [Catharanthus roseus]|uniref:Uncharacterized protein n=1 Tax=Catharanthus roseus TaxID=4058 RepID=A0ACC0BHL6_CATRO|nr:hypothetical protein M9H77_12534 [Catharanthus roseus]
MYIPLKLEDVHIFWRSLEINGLSGIGGQQSTQENMELRRVVQNILHLVIPLNPKDPVSGAPPIAFIKGRRKTNSNKRDKSHWEHIQISHTRILLRVLVEEGDRHMCLGVEIEHAQDSCMILPFYSASVRVGDTIVIAHLADSEHFIAVTIHENNFPLRIMVVVVSE